MSAIKNVTIVGGSGKLGSFVLDKLIDHKNFNVRALKRTGSSSSYPAGVEVIEVDFSSLESLTAGLKDQDALVSLVGDAGVPGQILLADAAIAAGVKRFLPSDFGSDMSNPNCRKVPVFAKKVQVEDYLIEKSKTSALTYTFVYNGAFLDFVLSHNIILDMSKYQPTLYDGGDYTFGATTRPTIGDAVVGVLTHPAETQNRNVYVAEVTTSQNQLLSLAKQIAPDKPWEPVSVDLDEIVAVSYQKLAQGIHDLPTVLPILIQTMLSPKFGGNFAQNDNKLLGIQEKSEDFVKELLVPLVK